MAKAANTTSSPEFLREQILASPHNAVVIFPKTVSDYQSDMLASHEAPVKDVEAFKIITLSVDRYPSAAGFKATLVSAACGGHWPVELVVGPDAADRAGALDALLKTCEHCLALNKGWVKRMPRTGTKTIVTEAQHSHGTKFKQYGYVNTDRLNERTERNKAEQV